MNNKRIKLEHTLLEYIPKGSDDFQTTLNTFYDYRSPTTSSKLLKRSNDLLVAWKKSHDESAPYFETLHQQRHSIDLFYRRKLLECCMFGNDAGFYDLHCLQRGSAYYFIKNVIHQLKQTIQHPTELKLIPGKGKHSYGAPVLQGIIVEICKEAGLNFQPIIDRDGRWGKVIVTVVPKTQRILTLVLPTVVSAAAVAVALPTVVSAAVAVALPAADALEEIEEDNSSESQQSIVHALQGLTLDSLDFEDIDQAPAHSSMGSAVDDLCEDNETQALDASRLNDVMAGLCEEDIDQAPAHPSLKTAMVSLGDEDIDQAFAHPSETISIVDLSRLEAAPILSSPKSISASLSPLAGKSLYTPQLFKSAPNTFQFNAKAKEFTPSTPLQKGEGAASLLLPSCVS